MTAVATMFDPAIARRQMVDSQLRPNRVLDSRIIAAMGEVPRELFVPERLADVAYGEEDIESAHGRYLMEPMVLGRLLQSLDLEGELQVASFHPQFQFAGTAPEDITSTKKARVRLGKKSSAPRAEPSRNCFIACRPLSTT